MGGINLYIVANLVEQGGEILKQVVDLLGAVFGRLFVRSQLVDSRNFLRNTFHIPSNSFCYPSNKYNAAVIAAVQAAGYTNATTENSGYATRANPFTLNRFEIEGGVSQLQADLAQG